MSWPFDDLFEYRNHRYYFCDGEGRAYPLEPGEQDRIAFWLSLVLALVVLGFAGWGAFSLYLITQQFAVSATPAPGWLLDRANVYPAVAAYWGFTWLLSCVAWGGLALRLAEREAEQGVWPPVRDGVLKTTRPVAVLALGLIMYVFVAQGFGDACIVYRGIGNCEIVKISFF